MGALQRIKHKEWRQAERPKPNKRRTAMLTGFVFKYGPEKNRIACLKHVTNGEISLSEYFQWSAVFVLRKQIINKHGWSFPVRHNELICDLCGNTYKLNDEESTDG